MRNRMTGAAGAVVLSTVLLAGCGDDPDDVLEDAPDVGVPGEELTGTPGPGPSDEMTTDDMATGDMTTGGGTGGAVAVDDVLADPDAYVGQDLTVSGQVDEVLTDEVYTLSATDASRDPLLVLAPNTGTAAEADDLLVTGALEESFSVTDAEAFLGVDLDDAQFERFDGQPFFEAESVEPAGE